MPGEQYTVPDRPLYSAGYGLKTQFGILLPPGGKVAAYLRSTGPQDGDDRAIQGNLVATLASALQRCRAGQGDTVVVLPGHSESGLGTTMLANLVNGTKIIGVGQGSAMPTFRWTATSDTWALTKNDVTLQGLRLRMEGAAVTAGITVTGADCEICDCDIEVSSGVVNKVTTAITLNAGADRTKIRQNKIRGLTGFALTDGILVGGALDQVEIERNRIIAPSAAANGLIRVSAAATNLYIGYNTVYNTTAASTAAIVVGNVAADGIIEFNNVGILQNGVASATGITFGVASLMKAFQNFCSDEPNRSGVLSPVVVAT